MILENIDIIRSNCIYKFLKNKSEDYFEENDIIKCNQCNNTGLEHSKLFDKDSKTVITSWDTMNYCSKCKGVGYILNNSYEDESQIDSINFVCKNCNGSGCRECDNTGIVDWVAHMVGR